MIQRLRLAVRAALYILRYGAEGGDVPAMTVFRVRSENCAWSAWSSDPRKLPVQPGSQYEIRELFLLPPRSVVPVVGRTKGGGAVLNKHGRNLPDGTALFGTPYPAIRDEKETHDFMESKTRETSA